MTPVGEAMQQRTRIAVAVTLALVAMAPAQAQRIERVEVTGSRIRQVDLETAQPLQVLTQEQIRRTGLVSVGDILNTLSTSGTPAFSKGATLGVSRDQGGQYLNLRNLGANRLLVLVDGRRWTQSVGGFTDLSTIPAAMIERIEVLKDGASAIYGSDAIAGVVNIILKKSIQGGQASAYAGQNEAGDGKSNELTLSHDFGDERASLMLALTHSEQGAVWARDRAVTATTYGPAHPADNLGVGPWGRITAVGRNGSSNTVPAQGGFNQYLNHSGGSEGDGTGSNARNPASYHPYTGAQADLYNSTSQMMFTSPSRLDSVFARGSVALPRDMRFSATAMFAERLSSRQVAGYPVSSLAQPRYPVYIDRNSYYNPYGNGVAGAGRGQDLFFYRRTIEVPRVTDNRSRTLHVDAVLEGTLLLGATDWNWNLGYNHGAIKGRTAGTGNLNLVNLKKALGPSFMNAQGTVQCGTPAAPIPTAECVPFDILGGPSAATEQALGYVMSTSRATYGSRIGSATADINGELLALPAGALGLAAGLEHRSVRGDDRPGAFEQAGYSTDPAANTTIGKYSVREAYLELNIPLLKGKFLAEQLGVNLASRHADYSNFGSTTNSKASLMWKPYRDLLARANYAQGFRAPALGDTFGGGSQTYDSYLDPCDALWGESTRNADVRTRCAAAGVPAAFRQLNQAGVAVGSGGGQTPAPFESGVGNAGLQPETAVTRTLGLVFTPSFLDGVSLSLDVFDIRVENRITLVSASYVINQCYISGVQSFCNNILRDPVSGQIASFSRGNLNLGELNTRGLDLALSWRLPRTRAGQFNIRSESTYVDRFRTKANDTAAWVEYAGEFGVNRVKSNLALDWSLGNWSATLAARYYSHVKTHCWRNTTTVVAECSDPAAPVSWGTGYNRQGGVAYSDLSVGYTLPWKGRLQAGTNNVFNRKPVIVYDANAALSSVYGSTSSSSSVDPDRPIDRFIYLRYTQGF